MPGCSKCKPNITGESVTGKGRRMITDNRNAGAGKISLQRILQLSWRISHYAPPMKPFLRFSAHADSLYKGKTSASKHFFWDFDGALQKILLGMARTLATSAEINEACSERWKINLDKLYQRKKRELAELQRHGGVPRLHSTPRSEFICSRVKPGSRLLYAGCGAGAECLSWAQRGYEVVGIDTDEQLVGMANDWAKYLQLPFQAFCMDAENFAFAARAFDGFLLEFYGFQPAPEQALALQRGLAGVLNEKGKGFISAPRKKYASYWYRMSNFGYPGSMSHWLESQSRLDHCFSPMDACEEKLAFGLYMRSHTLDSLSRELAGVFAVQECRYEEYDPRYLLSVVARKDRFSEAAPASGNDGSGDWPKQEYLPLQGVAFEDILNKIHASCDLLESHKLGVERFFLNHSGAAAGKSPLAFIDTDIPRFIELLEHIYEIRSSAA